MVGKLVKSTSLSFTSFHQHLLVQRILAMIEEDIGYGDVTTSALIPSTQMTKARFFTREPGVIAGIELTATVLKKLGCTVTFCVKDGSKIKLNDTLLKATGSAVTFLNVERSLLNLLQRMSGIATLTAKMLKKIRKVNPKIRIAATRKTAPGLRIFDKLAVIAGGGDPHRWRLDDAVLIKDNHLVFIKDITKAIMATREQVSFTCPIEVEVTSLKMAITASEAGADAILLDNFSPSLVTSTIKAIKQLNLSHFPLIEVSGNITLDNVTEYAEAGADIISAGCLTHSVNALDLSLDLQPEN